MNLKMNLILKGLKKCMSFSIINKLIFIDSFQFLHTSLDSLLKNLVKIIFSVFDLRIW